MEGARPAFTAVMMSTAPPTGPVCHRALPPRHIRTRVTQANLSQKNGRTERWKRPRTFSKGGKPASSLSFEKLTDRSASTRSSTAPSASLGPVTAYAASLAVPAQQRNGRRGRGGGGHGAACCQLSGANSARQLGGRALSAHRPPPPAESAPPPPSGWRRCAAACARAPRLSCTCSASSIISSSISVGLSPRI
jgi:hypothetical protein